MILPIILIAQAYASLHSLNGVLEAAARAADPRSNLADVQKLLRSSNDYLLFSQLSAERANEAVLINKQVMKSVVMQIGFAVCSVGLMFIVLGITDGGATTRVSWMTLKVDFKTASTGVLVFVIGAAMATAGGVLRNDYNTVPIPPFAPDGSVNSAAMTNYAYSLDAYRQCMKLPAADREGCFARSFAKINKEVLQ
jgi:hypothetical protein